MYFGKKAVVSASFLPVGRIFATNFCSNNETNSVLSREIQGKTQACWDDEI